MDEGCDQRSAQAAHDCVPGTEEEKDTMWCDDGLYIVTLQYTECPEHKHPKSHENMKNSASKQQEHDIGLVHIGQYASLIDYRLIQRFNR